MASKTQICNLALNHLGMKAIQNLTGVSPSQVACNAFYDTCKEDVFSEYRWPFANYEQLLSLLENEVLGWIYVYAYPAKAAQVWAVYNEATVVNKDEQEFEVKYIQSLNEKVLCSNTDIAYAEYTYIIDDATLFNPKFVMALSYRLASAMAHQLTGDEDLGIKLMQIYGAFISDTKRLANDEKVKKPPQNSSYQNSR